MFLLDLCRFLALYHTAILISTMLLPSSNSAVNGVPLLGLGTKNHLSLDITRWGVFLSNIPCVVRLMWHLSDTWTKKVGSCSVEIVPSRGEILIPWARQTKNT